MQMVSSDYEILSGNVAQFCFPDPASDVLQLSANPTPQFHNFVLTTKLGMRVYVSALRLALPSPYLSASALALLPHAPLHAPRAIAYCLLSPVHWPVLHAGILRGLLAVHSTADGSGGLSRIHEFLSPLHSTRLPAPGGTLLLKLQSLPSSLLPGATVASVSTIHERRFERSPADQASLLHNVNFEPLLAKLGARSLLRVISSLLFERRVIFVGESVATVSWCVQAATALLYPFCWQHVYVPVLPRTMLSSCCAPMPFVVGLVR
jgi:DENN (AEX-3) domain-containing protein/uDENN domain-containing protein